MGSIASKLPKGGVGTEFVLDEFAQSMGIGVNCAGISEDQSLLATGGDNSIIYIWDISSISTADDTPITSNADCHHELLTTFEGHERYITDLQFTNDLCVISASADTTVRKWDLTKGSCVAVSRSALQLNEQ
ncbi:hypothetical protein Ciccas_004579 [Cichlidogyrus casuarinus]|uniref:Uncharacterized protein n=1 Tax=Cichlidogyrus casuarinus TaxID=1844966 RepID=A0ABD2QB65_9PLAT